MDRQGRSTVNASEAVEKLRTLVNDLELKGLEIEGSLVIHDTNTTYRLEDGGWESGDWYVEESE